jgi:hypothetical protein
MSKPRPMGICHICGQYGVLSFEHIPPRAAFNDRPVIRMQFEEAIYLGPGEAPKGIRQQRGAGQYTLCERCNNNTGAWYGRQFVAWCYQGMEILARAGGKPSLIYLNYLFPLPIIKQILVMFFSVNGSKFQEGNPELVRFVLNREARYLPPKYRIYVYYNIEGTLRSSGIVATLDWRNGPTKMVLMSEISYPPFGYVLVLGSPPPDARLFDISHFASYEYNEFAVIPLQLPVLPTHLGIPGDYRNRAEILEQMAKSEAQAKPHVG